jgi:hypothetical protein
MVPDGHVLLLSSILYESKSGWNSDVANEIDFGRNMEEKNKHSFMR